MYSGIRMKSSFQPNRFVSVRLQRKLFTANSEAKLIWPPSWPSNVKSANVKKRAFLHGKCTWGWICIGRFGWYGLANALSTSSKLSCLFVRLASSPFWWLAATFFLHLQNSKVFNLLPGNCKVFCADSADGWMYVSSDWLVYISCVLSCSVYGGPYLDLVNVIYPLKLLLLISIASVTWSNLFFTALHVWSDDVMM